MSKNQLDAFPQNQEKIFIKYLDYPYTGPGQSRVHIDALHTRTTQTARLKPQCGTTKARASRVAEYERTLTC